MLKVSFSVLIFLSVSSISFGLTITGKVTDGKNNLPFVNVLLLQTDSTFITGVTTDSIGEFKLAVPTSGQYLISASMIGYAGYFSPLITVTYQSLHWPDIVLKELPTSLSEVVVHGQKLLFEQKTDRLIINVGSSITSSGNTVLEVLQKSPGVVVNRQTNSMNMNGKSGVRIMINEKLMQVSMDVAMQLLAGMSASTIEKIELITAPPSKYDADGNAGIIHIITKAIPDQGTQGVVGITIGKTWAENFGGHVNISHRGKNFAYQMDYSILSNHNLHNSLMKRQSVIDGSSRSVYDSSHRENSTVQQNLTAGFEWNLNKKTTLDLLLTGFKRNWRLKNAYSFDNNQIEDEKINSSMFVNEGNTWQSATGSIGLNSRLNSKSTLTANLDYLYYNNNNPSTYDVTALREPLDRNEISQIDLKKKTPIQFLIGKTDYQYQVSPTLLFETGIKAVRSHLANDVFVQRETAGVRVVDPLFTSSSTLHEIIAAAYVSTQWRMGTNWQVNTGTRYEYTQTNISTPIQRNLVERKYGYFFPNVSVKKILTAEKDIQLLYSKRITRPTYNDIAPYVFFWGPATFSSGNISLYPAIADALTFGFHLKQWMVSLQATHTKKEIASYQPALDPQTNNLIYSSQNLDYLNTISITNNYSMRPFAWWEIQNSITAQYQEGRIAYQQITGHVSRYGINANMVNSIKLPSNISFEISGSYQSKIIFGISTLRAIGSLNAGIQKNMGTKGIIKLSMDDILYTTSWQLDTKLNQNNLVSYFKYDWHNQYIRLTYTRNLGNTKLKLMKLKSGSEEERKRIN
jgi:hypothetical protein